MWVLQLVKDESVQYRLPLGAQVSVGRMDSNILISNDNSVSRNHAILKVESATTVLVSDVGSKVGTFVGPAGDRQLKKNEEVALAENSVVLFGAKMSRYKLVKVNFVFCTSGIDVKTPLYKEFTRLVKLYEGKIVKKWNPSVTHLFTPASKPIATTKMMHALVKPVNIVTLHWLIDTEKKTQKTNSYAIPDCRNYVPSSESLAQFFSSSQRADYLDCSQAAKDFLPTFELIQSRTQLFKDFTFVFVTKSSDFEAITSAAGAKNVALYDDASLGSQIFSFKNPMIIKIDKSADDVIEKYSRMDIPVISSSKISQCVICNQTSTLHEIIRIAEMNKTAKQEERQAAEKAKLEQEQLKREQQRLEKQQEQQRLEKQQKEKTEAEAEAKRAEAKERTKAAAAAMSAEAIAPSEQDDSINAATARRRGKKRLRLVKKPVVEAEPAESPAKAKDASPKEPAAKKSKPATPERQATTTPQQSPKTIDIEPRKSPSTKAKRKVRLVDGWVVKDKAASASDDADADFTFVIQDPDGEDLVLKRAEVVVEPLIVNKNKNSLVASRSSSGESTSKLPSFKRFRKNKVIVMHNKEPPVQFEKLPMYMPVDTDRHKQFRKMLDQQEQQAKERAKFSSIEWNRPKKKTDSLKDLAELTGVKIPVHVVEKKSRKTTAKSKATKKTKTK